MANSFRQMRDGDVIKRTDSGMFIRIEELHVKPNFNRREDDDRTRQADDELFNYLMNGGTVPPLEVVV
ncbi:chromosome partitioning protein ParB, partial [Klebsiella michiganensis]